MNKTIIQIQKHLEHFKEYHKKNPAWGSLHIVLDDGNVSDADVLFCHQYAQENDDEEGRYLARILLGMSKTQRNKIAALA